MSAGFPGKITDWRSDRLAPPPVGRLVDVVIDTDPTNEIDDQFAVIWALMRSDRLRVLGLHACPYLLGPGLAEVPGMFTELDLRSALRGAHKLGAVVGPAEAVRRAELELLHITDLMSSDTPVCAGSPSFLADRTTPVPSRSVSHLLELSRQEREGPLYVVAIGCLTNVASALLADPTLVERIVVVWTSGYPSFWPRCNVSYNMCLDLAATNVVMESGVPLVYLPGYYVGEELRVSLPDLREHVAGRGTVGDYLYRISESSAMLGTSPGRSKVIWDLIAVAWLVEPSWLSTELVATPRLDADLRWVTDREGAARHLMLEAYDVDRDSIFADLYRCLDLAGRN